MSDGKSLVEVNHNNIPKTTNPMKNKQVYNFKMQNEFLKIVVIC